MVTWLWAGCADHNPVCESSFENGPVSALACLDGHVVVGSANSNVRLWNSPSKEAIEIKNPEELKEKIKEINNLTQNLSLLVNNVLDISTLEITNIKVYNTKYNIKNVFSGIVLIITVIMIIDWINFSGLI